jgi:hypothetical protein
VRLQTTENVLPLEKSQSTLAEVHFESRKLLLKRILPLIVATIGRSFLACPVDGGNKLPMMIQAYDPLPNAM